MHFILSLLISGIGVFIAAQILPGVKVDGFITALEVAVILGLLNTFIKPVLTILTLPINILTLGLFSLVINAVIILIVDSLIPGFTVSNFLWAIIFSLVLSLINSVLQSFTK